MGGEGSGEQEGAGGLRHQRVGSRELLSREEMVAILQSRSAAEDTDDPSPMPAVDSTIHGSTSDSSGGRAGGEGEEGRQRQIVEEEEEQEDEEQDALLRNG